MSAVTLALGGLEPAVRRRVERWRDDGAVLRLWSKDPTLWASVDTPELQDRLGWLHLPARMGIEADRLREFAASVRRDTDRVVLLGMGGSSLAPEVFARTFGAAEGFPDLVVLDTTHPDAVRAVVDGLDLDRTLVLVSSKSGTTVETLSLFRLLWQRVSETSASPGHRFVAITDPGSKLEELARRAEFLEIFGAPPDVGGRYSALSVFGLVPAALLGVDLDTLEGHAHAMARFCAEPAGGPGLELGAVLGEAAAVGRDKLTLVTSATLQSFPAWVEQLVAESLGKDGRGIVPVVGETLGRPETYGDDRLFVATTLAGEEDEGTTGALDALVAAGHPVVRVRLDEPAALSAEMYRWEMATALAATVLGVHPFDQPDVQLAKKLASEALTAAADGADDTSAIVTDRRSRLATWLEETRAGDYLAVQAFLAPGAALDEALAELQETLRERTGLAVSVGYGPRFLHSTGQLHKGGPATGHFLQLVDRPRSHLPIPETDQSFERLVAAQARGDLEALRQRDRRILRLDLGSEPEAGVRALLGTGD